MIRGLVNESRRPGVKTNLSNALAMPTRNFEKMILNRIVAPADLVGRIAEAIPAVRARLRRSFRAGQDNPSKSGNGDGTGLHGPKPVRSGKW